MFGAKDRQRDSLKVANNFEVNEVRWSLTGEWLTVALARFEQTFTSRYDRQEDDFPKAVGVVHFDHASDVAIPVVVTLDEEQEAERGKVGVAHYTSRNKLRGGGTELITLELRLNDKRGKIRRALQDAFTCAAISQERFVHVSFRRVNPATDRLVGELSKQRYGADHDLQEVQIRQRTHLANTPSWAWAWERDF